MLSHKRTERCPDLDVAVLATGSGRAGSLATLCDDDLRRLVEVNLVGTARVIHRLLPRLRDVARARGRANLVVSSIAGLSPQSELSVYGATKAALVSPCQSLTVEFAADRVAVTAVCPGYVDTEMARWQREEIGADNMIAADDIAELSDTRAARPGEAG